MSDRIKRSLFNEPSSSGRKTAGGPRRSTRRTSHVSRASISNPSGRSQAPLRRTIATHASGGELATPSSPDHRADGSESAKKPMGITPMKRVQPLVPQQTAEHAAKVVKALQQDQVEWQQLRLTGSLKTMTSKQFVEIINYFGTFITGKPVVNRTNECDTDILAFVRSVLYPYNLAKSALRTPTAMHAYPECVALLAWLSDFVTVANTTEADHDADDLLKAANAKVIGQDARFPNIDYTKYFADEVRKGFVLWNSEKDVEFEKQKDELTDNLIAAATGGRHDGTTAIEAAIADIKRGVEHLKGIPCIVANEKKFHALEQQFHRDEGEAELLAVTCDKLSDEVNSLRVPVNAMAQRMKIQLDENQSLSDTIETQRHSVRELNELKSNISASKLALDAITEENELLKADGGSMKLQVANLTQQKITAIKELNVALMRFYQCVSQLPTPTVPANALRLEPTAASADIEVVQQNMVYILGGIEAIVKRVTRESAAEWERLEVLMVKLNANRRRQCSLEDQSEAKRKELAERKTQYAQKTIALTTEFNDKMQKYEEDMKKADEVEAELQQKLAESADLEAARKEISDACSQRAREILDAKREINDLFEQFLNEE